MYRGYVKIYRKIEDFPFWLAEKFTHGQAWVDLILLANHKPNTIYRRNIKIEVLRGQVGWTVKGLAKRWQWSRGKVDRFLKELENGHQITYSKNNVSAVITVNNYETYQPDGHQTDTKQTPNGHQTDTNNNDNNYKHDKEEERERGRINNITNFIEQQVENIYKAYPKKTDEFPAKVEIKKAIHRLIEDHNMSPEDAVKFLMERTKMYAMSKVGKSRRWCKKPKYWYADGNYNDDPKEWNVNYNDDNGENNGKNNYRNKKIKDREKFAPEKTGGFFNAGNFH